MKQRDIDKLNRESEKLWRKYFDRMPAKVGTVPMGIWVTHAVAQEFVDGTLKPGTRVEFYEHENGQKMGGIVDKLEPILFLTKM